MGRILGALCNLRPFGRSQLPGKSLDQSMNQFFLSLVKSYSPHGMQVIDY